MKYLILVISLTFITGCKTSNDLSKIIKTTYSKKHRCGIKPKTIIAHSDTLCEKINFINYQNDTICFLQGYDVENGTIYRAIWTDTGKMEYVSNVGSVLRFDSGIFEKSLCTLIEKWNISTIRKEEERMIGRINGGLSMTGMRVFLKENKVEESKCIRFREF